MHSNLGTVIFTFVLGLCFLPILSGKWIFQDWSKWRAIVLKNESFEKDYCSAMELKNMKTKCFAAFWVKNVFSNFFSLRKSFRTLYWIFWFSFQIIRKLKILKFEKSKGDFKSSEIVDFVFGLGFSEGITQEYCFPQRLESLTLNSFFFSKILFWKKRIFG